MARSTTLVNLRAAYHVSKGFDVSLDVFNLLGRKVNDVEYYYASQLRGEAAPVDDRHFHPAESRMIRLMPPNHLNLFCRLYLWPRTMIPITNTWK